MNLDVVRPARTNTWVATVYVPEQQLVVVLVLVLVL